MKRVKSAGAPRKDRLWSVAPARNPRSSRPFPNRHSEWGRGRRGRRIPWADRRCGRVRRGALPLRRARVRRRAIAGAFRWFGPRVRAPEGFVIVARLASPLTWRSRGAPARRNFWRKMRARRSPASATTRQVWRCAALRPISSRACSIGTGRSTRCSKDPMRAPRPRRLRRSTVATALLIGAAQILFLEVPDHAAVDLAVRLAREDRMALHFAGLVNAVLRRIAREGKERIAVLDAPVLDTPPWLMARWIKTYGEATAHAIAAAHGREPALDLTVKADPESWAAELQ